MGFLIPMVSKSASLRDENFLPVSPFLCKWFTILSSTPIWRKKVTISSVLYDERFPSLGIVISFSGMNLETAEKILYWGNEKMSKEIRKLYTYFISKLYIKSTVGSMFIIFGSLLEISYLDKIWNTLHTGPR